MNRSYLDIHILQTVPPSNLNRDDTGSPKTAVFGGVRRARVSSQAWKRATRLAFEQHLDKSELGVRTKRVVELVADEICRLAPGLEPESQELAKKVLAAADIKLASPRKGGVEESGYLLLLSRLQIAALAQAAVGSAESGASLDKKTIQSLIKGKNSVDLALFGRMVADVTDLNVDAAAQVAHALSVHAVDNEYDYFTAVDDHKQEDADEDAGAGMIGTVEFNSATLYRYATVNLQGLLTNLGDTEATRRAVEAFLQAFVRSMPSGKQNTFANRTLPDAVVVRLRGDQPVSLVGAFEQPVVSGASEGRVAAAAAALAAHTKEVDDAFGADLLGTWVSAVGERTVALDALSPRVPFDRLVADVGAAVAGRLEGAR